MRDTAFSFLVISDVITHHKCELSVGGAIFLFADEKEFSQKLLRNVKLELNIIFHSLFLLFVVFSGFSLFSLGIVLVLTNGAGVVSLLLVRANEKNCADDDTDKNENENYDS